VVGVQLRRRFRTKHIIPKQGGKLIEQQKEGHLCLSPSICPSERNAPSKLNCCAVCFCRADSAFVSREKNLQIPGSNNERHHHTRDGAPSGISSTPYSQARTSLTVEPSLSLSFSLSFLSLSLSGCGSRPL